MMLASIRQVLFIFCKTIIFYLLPSPRVCKNMYSIKKYAVVISFSYYCKCKLKVNALFTIYKYQKTTNDTKFIKNYRLYVQTKQIKI